MSDENTIRVRKLGSGELVQVLPDGSTRPYVGPGSDWERVDAMTEEEIFENALSDPDNPPLTDEDFKRIELIPNVYLIRNKLGLSQLDFAATYGIAPGLIQSWERGPSYPDSAASSLLRIIEQDPEGTKATLARALQKTG